jgi:hypothetical protein
MQKPKEHEQEDLLQRNRELVQFRLDVETMRTKLLEVRFDDAIAIK